MAARSGRGRSSTSSSSRTQEMTGRPSYEDIEPKSAEWKEEQTAHVLIVHLPGFVKEQIRVTYYNDNSRSFNVQGDRPLGNNRFGRLNVDYTTPDNSRMKEMQGRFQDEVLTITIPKELISPFFAPKEATTGAQSPPVISKPPKVHPQMPPPPKTPLSSTTKQPERQSDYEEFKYPKREPNEKFENPKKQDLVNSKAGESQSGVDDAKKKRRDEKVGESEKNLLVNMGGAALVLVALGAYVGYNFACPRSAEG